MIIDQSDGNEKILLAHGSGGKAMHALIRDVLGPLIGIEDFNDSAVVPLEIKDADTETLNGRLVFTTDSYVVSPLFFPGGDIGSLSVNGTINDISMTGASTLCLSLSLIIEEGLPMDSLIGILGSIKKASEAAGVRIVTGDTKVVNKGKGDGIFINTSGIGLVRKGTRLSPKNVIPGDVIILSGPVGNHGVAVMAERNGLTFDPPVLSDTAALNELVDIMLSHTPEIHAMRDPTRGGLATTLKEIALEAGACIEIDEEKIPLTARVRGACELLGIDPLYVANEGILVAFAGKNVAKSLLDVMKKDPLGKNSAVIGRVTGGPERTVLLKTLIGGTRIVDMLHGEQLPRIC
ncbi:MAG TPA: hydrogenase expression/formation protein HypE [Nitrospirae bacterium]|nr:hydrogenase expression/formation protein HypE [Nitrospirota bacterium]